MKKTMKTIFFRDIKNSKGRFISIVLLMFISTFTLIGLKEVGPDIRLTADKYFSEYNLADLQIIGTYGLDDNDMQVITQSIDGGEVEFGYFTDVSIGEDAEAIRVFSNSDNISKYELVEGSLPKEEGEIAISNQLRDEYQIGTELEIKQSSDEDSKLLKTDSYKVVGYVNSLEILSTSDLGTTNVGTGQLNGYGVVTEDNFDSDYATIARITYEDLDGKDAFLDEYLSAVQDKKSNLNDKLADLPTKRLATVKEDAQAEIKKNEKKLKDAEAELDDAKEQLEDAKEELDEAKAEIDNGYAELEANQTKLDNSKVELKEAQEELDASKPQLDAAQKELDSGKEQFETEKAKLVETQNQLTSLQSEANSLAADATNENISEAQLLARLGNLASQASSIQSQLGAGGQSTSIPSSMSREQIAGYASSISSQLGDASATITSNLETEQAKLDSAQLEIDNGKAALVTGQAQIDEGQAQLVTGQAQIDQGYIDLEEGEEEYNKGLEEYNENLEKFNEEEPEAREEIADGYEDIEEAKEDIDNLDLPVYNVYTRSETPTSGGYQVFSSLATSIDKVANVFPILLYAVAVLVTFTTMTRFVEDERITTGTLLSIGYSEEEIKRKYIIYGALSSSIGAVIGIILGAIFIPELLYTAFRGEFTTPDLILGFTPAVAVVAMVISVLCAVVPAFIVTNGEFKNSPASLLLPKPPGKGSKIFLERIKPVWNRLSFSHKVTARNIFRYKKRMFMTIFGVSGSVALLFTGLAVQDSISNISDIQFDQVIQYDMIAVGEDNQTSNVKNKIVRYLDDDRVDNYMQTYLETLSIDASDKSERQTITMMVADDFDNYIDFHERKTKESIELENGSVIITERLATLLDLDVGDSFEVKSAENLPIELEVGGIMEMYTGHFVFANKTTYKQLFGTEYEPNSYIINLVDPSLSNVEEMAIEMIDMDGITTVMQNISMITQVASMSESLNSVMTLLIVLSVMLAVVILYNITNINVNERMRELSTTKVLGYYDNEVTMYIYRETAILSIFGILLGFVFGRLIHLFMITVVAPANMMFDPIVHLRAYAMPAILIIIVSIVLGIIIHNRLKHVDMLEALKSVE